MRNLNLCVCFTSVFILPTSTKNLMTLCPPSSACFTSKLSPVTNSSLDTPFLVTSLCPRVMDTTRPGYKCGAIKYLPVSSITSLVALLLHCSRHAFALVEKYCQSVGDKCNVEYLIGIVRTVYMNDV